MRVNAGSYTITCSGVAATNYVFAYTTAALAINRASLMVTANSATGAYGVANPTLGATISGFVLGQTLATSGITGSAACTTSATTTSNPSAYPITCAAGSLASANYAFVFSRGAPSPSARHPPPSWWPRQPSAC